LIGKGRGTHKRIAGGCRETIGEVEETIGAAKNKKFTKRGKCVRVSIRMGRGDTMRNSGIIDRLR
jgi:hypothetical protein